MFWIAKIRLISLVLVMLVAIAGTVSAATVTVRCSEEPGPSYYTRINDALMALRSISNRNHLVQIWGTCTEDVQVDDFEYLTLEGKGNAKIVDPDDFDGNPALQIRNSNFVIVKQLIIQGVDESGSESEVLVAASRVTFENCSIVEGPGHGLDIMDLSSVTVRSCEVHDNGMYGIFLRGGSVLDVQDGRFERNLDGIRVAQNSVAGIRGSAVIADNMSDGLRVYGGRAVIGGQVQILRSEFGIAVNSGTVITSGSSLLIQGNRQWGVFLSADSSIRFGALETTIEQNGTAGCGTLGCGGITAYVGSHIDLLTCTVRNNYGVGAWIGPGSAARVFENTITGNQGSGVHLSGSSGVMFYNNTSISGNSGFDLSCDPNSYSVGDKVGIARVSCPGFVMSPMPGIGKGRNR